MVRIDIERVRILEAELIELLKNYFNYEESTGVLLKLHSNFGSKQNLRSKMLRFFHDNFAKIVTLKPDEFSNQNISFLKDVGYDEYNAADKTEYKAFKEMMSNFYDKFFQKQITTQKEKITIGRWLTRNLDINVCPYCNHNYTFTINDIENKVNSRPEFDHFWNKSKYPLFALSLYNLVPSCSICNKIKGIKEITFNPYGNTDEDIIFRVKNKEKGKAIHWITGEKPKIDVVHRIDGKNESSPTNQNTSVKKLGIDKIYDEHGKFVEELLDKIFAYHSDYYESLIKSFKGLGKTPEQIDTIIWSAYLNNEGKRPMSKLTHDILKQIGIKNY